MSKSWSDEELRASIKAYLQMMKLEHEDKPYVKTDFYKSLSDKFDRTPGAFEYRMQNISHIFDIHGRQWLPGLKPYQNVGTNVAGRIEAILADIEENKIEPYASFEAEIRYYQDNIENKPPEGNKTPKTTHQETTQYERDPRVVAWVLNKAGDICECCDEEAPFKKGDGNPYLEVHHIKRLADGGEDTVNNAIALCPNCHRELHYGLGKLDLAKSLVVKINRLNTSL